MSDLPVQVVGLGEPGSVHVRFGELDLEFEDTVTNWHRYLLASLEHGILHCDGDERRWLEDVAHLAREVYTSEGSI